MDKLMSLRAVQHGLAVVRPPSCRLALMLTHMIDGVLVLGTMIDSVQHVQRHTFHPADGSVSGMGGKGGLGGHTAESDTDAAADASST